VQNPLYIIEKTSQIPDINNINE